MDNAAAETVMGLFQSVAVANGSPFRAGPLKNADDVEQGAGNVEARS